MRDLSRRWTQALLFLFVFGRAWAADGPVSSCEPPLGAVLDPRLIVVAPCDEKKFPVSETAINLLELEKEKGGGFEFIRLKQMACALDPRGARGCPERKQGMTKEDRGNLEVKLQFLRRTQCCGKTVQTKNGFRGRVAGKVAGDYRFPTPFSIPYVAEIGLRLRSELALGGNVSVNLECVAGACYSLDASAGISADVYARLLAGLAESALGAKVDTVAEARYCPQASPDSALTYKAEAARITVFGEVSAAWGLFSYRVDQPVFQDYLPLKVL